MSFYVILLDFKVKFPKFIKNKYFFFIVFFLVYKNVDWILKKKKTNKQRKASKRVLQKVSKSFRRKEKQDASICSWKVSKSFWRTKKLKWEYYREKS